MPAKVLIAASMPNIHNFHGFDCFDNYLPSKHYQNKTIREEGLSGVFMDGSDVNSNALTYGENAILVPEADAPMKPSWYRGGWWDSITDFWQEFENGRLSPDCGRR